MKKAKKNDNAAVLMELGALTNLLVMLKNSQAKLTTTEKVEELITNKLAQVQ